jgi:hypothetical protein
MHHPYKHMAGITNLQRLTLEVLVAFGNKINK